MEEWIEEKLKRIGKWWNGENKGRPLLWLVARTEQACEPINLNKFWQSPESEPEFEKIVDTQIKNISGWTFLAESYPCIPHLWGSRGTPMSMAAYLGSKVNFREETVWFEPIIDDWRNFKIKFDKNNYWVSISKKLLETQLKKYDGNFLIWLPDFGDALTVFSLLRGVEKLLLDLIEIHDVIKVKIGEFIDVWKKAHSYFWDLYRKKLPGDCSWLLWAPGKTYACQCDFSTMISSEMFKEFVVPEIEMIGEYLDFIVWHLDGPEEIKHLDTLLQLPQIKAIQIVHGAGKPPCCSSLWIPQMKKIQEKGRVVIAYANTKEEVETLFSNLNSEKLFLFCGLNFKDKSEADEFIKWTEKF